MLEFAYYSDPTSSPGAMPTRTFSPDGYTITHTGLTIDNQGEAKPEIDLHVPFLWVRISDDPADPNADANPTLVPLDWSNMRGGWYAEDFHGSGASLLVTRDILTTPDAPDSQVAAGRVANEQRTGVLGFRSGDFDFLVENPLAEVRPLDRLPLADFGSFAAGESKDVALAFTCHWGDGLHPAKALRTSGGYFTLLPTETHHAAASHDCVF